jgi:hypothetical protein
MLTPACGRSPAIRCKISWMICDVGHLEAGVAAVGQ